MKAHRIAIADRTAMIGGGTCYRVEFKLAGFKREYTYLIEHYTMGQKRRDVRIPVEDGIMSDEHRERPCGWDKYHDWKKIEKRGKRIKAAVLRRAFPELANLRDYDSLPFIVNTGRELPSAIVKVKVNFSRHASY